MSASLALQYVLIALAVSASAWFVVKVQFPGAVRRLRIACALPLLREGRPAWLHAVGHRVAPAALASPGCEGCNSCDTRTP